MADLAQHNVSGAHAGETRRDFLILTATAIGAVGVAATIWPFIDSLNPARDTLALSTTEVDLAPVQVGQRLTVAWRGKPVFIDHRTPEEIKAAQDVNVADLRDPQPDSARLNRRLHPSRLHPARSEGRRPPRPLWRLVLPLPRLGL
jgi:ubiquinol-cytochrome c reductase iron-sulfur subunit